MEKNVSNEEAFWFCSSNGCLGRAAHNLTEFAEELAKVPIESLEFHLREDKNDFEAWVSNVLRKRGLSKNMASVKGQGLRGEELRNALLSLVNKVRTKTSRQKQPQTNPPVQLPA